MTSTAGPYMQGGGGGDCSTAGPYMQGGGG